MSPVAADCASAASAPGALAALLVVDGGAEGVLAPPVGAGLVEVEVELLDDPQPAIAITAASATTTRSLFMDGRLAT
jgi:hypothetical protein